MKKLLLATTAIALSFGASSAFAMSGAEISLSGNSKWTYKDVDDGENAGGGNNSSFAIGNVIKVESSATSDSGLTYGTSLALIDDGDTVGDDGMKLFVKGGFGEIRTGSAGAGDSFGIDADGFVQGEVSKVSGHSVAKAGDNSISYFTPSINGLTGAVSYSDAGENSKADVTELGLKFTTGVGGNDVSLQFARANVGGNGASTAPADIEIESVSVDSVDFTTEVQSLVEQLIDIAQTASVVSSDSYEVTSFGASFSIDSLTLRVASNSVDGNGDDREVFDLGASIALNDALTAGFYHRDGDEGEGDAKVDVNETGLGLEYTIAPGLTTNLAHSTWEKGEADGSATTAYIKVAF